MGLWAMGLMLAVCAANPPTAQPAATASRPAETFENKKLSPQEATAYRTELKTAIEMYSLEHYKEAAKQARQAAQRRGDQAAQDADAKAAALAQARRDKTQTNLYRFRHRKGMVISNHYQTMRDINQQRQQAKDAAAGDSARDSRTATKKEVNITTLERAATDLAQVPVHAKYGQMRSSVSALNLGITAMPSAMTVLDATDDTQLRQEAGDGLEQAFSQALEVFEKADPAWTAAMLTNQNAGLRAALTSPAAQGLAIYVAKTWQSVKDRTALNETQSLAADYWLKQAESFKKPPAASAAAAKTDTTAAKTDSAASTPQPTDSGDHAKRKGKRRNRSGS